MRYCTIIYCCLLLLFPIPLYGYIEFPPLIDRTSPRFCDCAPNEVFGADQWSGVLKSPMHPRPYCGPVQCGWTIQPSKDTFVTAVIDAFSINWYDTLDIRQISDNGLRRVAIKHTRLHGELDSAKKDSHFASSVGGGLRFLFNASHYNYQDSKGFQISWQRHLITDPSRVPCPPPVLFASAQPQKLPQLANAFPAGASCVFLINSSLPLLGLEPSVKLIIHRFDVEHLILKIFDTENYLWHGKKPLASIENGLTHKHQQMPFTVTSRTSSMTLLLRTKPSFENEKDDQQSEPLAESNALAPLAVEGPAEHVPQQNSIHSVHNTEGAWFDIEFRSAKSPCECFPPKLVLNRSHPVTLTSPGFPMEYCDSTNCTVLVQLEDLGVGHHQQQHTNTTEALRIRFDSFSTAGWADQLILWEDGGHQAHTQPMISLSNTIDNLHSITVDQHQFALSFVTDAAHVDTGFKLAIERIRKHNVTDCACPWGSQMHFLDGNQSHLQTMHISDQCMFLDCFWTFSPPKEANRGKIWRILLTINVTNPNGGIVEHYQGRNTHGYAKSSSLVAKSPHQRMDSTGSQVFEYYNTNGWANRPINVWYHKETPDSVWARRHFPRGSGPGQVRIHYEIRGECQCGERIHELSSRQWKQLLSPDYPMPYCRRMSCEWVFLAAEGARITINVSFFESEEFTDELKIYAGTNRSTKELTSLSGKVRAGSQFHLNESALTLQFQSDKSIQMRGFDLWLIAQYDHGSSPFSSHIDDQNGFHWALITLFFFAFLFVAAYVADRHQWIPLGIHNRLSGGVQSIFARGHLAWRRLTRGHQVSADSVHVQHDERRESVATVTFANPTFSPSISFRELQLAHPDD